MKTVTLPLEEYQELIKFKENWEKGLILSGLGSATHYISEEEFKSRIEVWCFERKVRLDRDLEDVIAQYRDVMRLRDQCAKEIEALADSLKTPKREHWLSKLFQLRRRFK